MPPTQFSSSNRDQQGGYNPMDSSSAWLEKQERSSSRAKWIVIASILGILAVIGIGVGVGVGVSKSNDDGDNKSSSNGGSSGSSSSDDDSNFEKNDALKQSFYGFAYTPEGSQLPDCGNSIGMFFSVLFPVDFVVVVAAASILRCPCAMTGVRCGNAVGVISVY